MKKRILTLALCLVLAVSLLPITAAAEEFTVDSVNSVNVVGDFCDWVFSESYLMQALGDSVYELTISNADKYYFDGAEVKFAINGGWTHNFGGTFVGSGVATDAVYIGKNIWILVPYDSATITFRLDLSKFDYATEKGAKFTITITDANHDFDTGWTSDETHHWHKCLNEGCTEVKDKALHVDNNNDHFCDDCQVSIHTWKFSKTDSGTFMATCNPGCTIGEVTVKLDAHSVTLPDSPFNARLEGKEQFETATGAVISKIRYDYKGSDGVWHKGVDPVAANAKAGEYQAFVQVSNLPRPVESDGVVAMAENPDGTYTAELFVKYTAVDPAVTAQTGDNRPIELMMAGVVLFSALAAAAFILDHKRKYSR